MASNKKMRSKALEAPCNVFELTPALSNLNSYYKQVKVEFLSSPELPKLSRTSHYPWPKFNNDGLFFTPAFVIPEDLALLTLVQDSLRKDYIQRIKANDEAETKDTLASLPIAEPEEQKRCGVCKVTYQSFQQHINQIGHKQNCINSKYTKHIYEFCNENYGSAEPKAQDSVPTLRIPHSPFIRKNSNPQMYKRPPVQKSVPACFSQPEQFEEHFLEDVNQIDIHNIDITPPVKRRRLN